LFVWKITAVIILGASGLQACFYYFLENYGPRSIEPICFASRRYRHLLIIIVLYGRDMFMSRRLIIFGNYMLHKSEIYVRD